MAPHPTIALREPANYGLRGWISTRSSDLAQVLSGGFPWGISGRPFVRADRAAFPATRRECLGIYQGSASGMKMSKGLMGRHLLGLAVAGLALVAGGTAFAELGQPAPWEYKLQEAGSPVMENIIW